MAEQEVKDTSSVYEIVTANVEGCEICYQHNLDLEIIVCKCGHSFCTDCFNNYYQIKMSEMDVYPLKCPSFKCQEDVYSAVRKYLPEPAYRRLKKMRHRQQLLTDPEIA